MKKFVGFLAGVVGFAAAHLGLLNFLPQSVASIIGALGAVFAALGIHSAATSGTGVDLSALGKNWKTIVGVLVALVGTLLSPDVANLLPAAWIKIVEFVATILTALGLYHAAGGATTKATASH